MANPHASSLVTPAVLLTACIGFVPLVPSGVGSAHDVQRAVQCALQLGAAGLLCWRWDACALRPVTLWLLITLTLLALMSSLRADFPAAALQELALCLGLGAIVWVFHGLARAGDERGVLRCVVATTAAYAGVVFALFGSALLAGEPLNARALAIGFDNPRFLNHVQTLLLPLLVLSAATESDLRWRWLARLTAMAQVAIVALDLARATSLAWLAAFVVLWLLGERRMVREALRIVMAGLMLGAAAFWVLPMVLGGSWHASFASPAELGKAHSRDYLWALAWQQFSQAPVLGAGPMHYAATPNDKAAHPHNLYLQLLAEVGLPASLVAMGLLLLPIVRAIRLRRTGGGGDTLLLGFMAAAIAALVDALFSGNFVMPLSQLWIAVTWGLLTGVLARQPMLQAGVQLRCWMLVPLLVSQLALCVAAWQQLQHTPPRLRPESPAPSISGEAFRPRFWRSGWI